MRLGTILSGNESTVLASAMLLPYRSGVGQYWGYGVSWGKVHTEVYDDDTD